MALSQDYTDTTAEPYLTYGHIQSWCFEAGVSFFQLFAGSFFDIDIRRWQVEKVQNFDQMFAGNTAFSRNLVLWNMSSATSISGM
jgi:hypothetical protein